MNAPRVVYLAAVAAVAFAATALAQSVTRTATAVILGTVGDTNLRPIGGADVTFAGSNVRVASDSLGRFQFVKVPAGKFIVIVRNIGFRPAANEIEVTDHDTLPLAFTLEPTVQELAVMVVTERTLSPKRGGCAMQIYLDAVPLGAIDLTYLPSPKDIAAIEVYAGSATLPLWLPPPPPPPPSRGMVGCGAILLWTHGG